MAQLRDPLRTRHIAKLVCAQIGEPRTHRELIEHQLLGNARKHGLAAVSEIAQPRGAIDRRTDVIALVAKPHLAGMHADPQPNRVS